MQQRIWVLWALMALSTMTGCSREESADAPVNESATNDSRVSDDNVFSDQVKSLEKAEAVEQALDDAAAKQRKALEQQE